MLWEAKRSAPREKTITTPRDTAWLMGKKPVVRGTPSADQKKVITTAAALSVTHVK